ncbi:uncharacterized protein BP01DRAFT_390340 [Aspergillus saccharolyticus JOP 1030-1]|uniref:Uncharacterized protein n=1 Tax=Aspergillus saccharolyticus JOP 1030-1 TaxID=1450539 RepID=A0A318ZSB0_9EURO|nr:hypothetical protein BP01DRAFT_390340 [Aspergillus saccharolyticus JOP 1030-1]PYH47243.1 hypothetical protein BP01DRAFT_390340 [Aspergillus saccharolyticus JOP 1030-1]
MSNSPQPPNDTRPQANERPSFQAPIRASSARALPGSLERALSRSPMRSPRQPTQSNARAVGLRDRKALRPSLTSSVSPLKPPRKAKPSPRLSSGLNVFAAPPRRVSTRITASDLTFQSPISTQQSIEALRHINTPDDQLTSELGSVTGDMDVISDPSQPSLQEIFEEPELPPTPTQLGLERPPGRSKGLLSSSPNSQQAKAARRRNTENPEQTPSKLRSVDYGEAEDPTGLGTTIDWDSFPEHILKKRKLRDELSDELEQLKKEIGELDNWSKELSQCDESAERDLTKLITLLSSSQPTVTTTSGPRSTAASISSLISTLLPFAAKAPPPPFQNTYPLNAFALHEHAHEKPYVTAFAPLHLTAFSEFVPGTAAQPCLEKHVLTFTAPHPFPSNRLEVTIAYEANPETQTLVSILVPTESQTGKTRMPASLQRWTDTRLSNPLLKLDVTGLCWGINRYWVAAILRAQLWSEMEEQHASLISGQKGSNARPLPHSDKRSTPDLRRILPHLERTSMLFQSNTRGPSLLLSCELKLDEWTSEPQLVPGISVSLISTSGGGITPSRRVERECKKLFHTMLTEQNGSQQEGVTSEGDPCKIQTGVILRATQCVLKILFDENDANNHHSAHGTL